MIYQPEQPFFFMKIFKIAIVVLIISLLCAGTVGAQYYENVTFSGQNYNGQWVIAGGEMLCIGGLMENNLPVKLPEPGRVTWIIFSTEDIETL